MTHSPFLTLHGVSHQLSDGRTLFSGLHAHFDTTPTGIVGDNGVGKSVLARILAGEIDPHAGRVLRSGSLCYLPQQIAARAGQTVAGLAGMQARLDALARIERGSTRPEDFDLVGEAWDLRQRWAALLESIALDDLDATTPASLLSGGERMRVALAGAFLSGRDFLILDEPSNHLDRRHRAVLHEQLHQWRGGLIVVSHDRELLESMPRIVELSAQGLRTYGGNYSFYAEHKAQAQAAAQQQLDHRRSEQRRETRRLHEQRERLERRQAQASRAAADANLPAILLGLRKSRSQASGGRQRARQASAHEALRHRARDAAQRVEQRRETLLFAPQDGATPSRVAELRAVALPFVATATRRIDLCLLRGQRIALTGPNGSGKSTLLQVLAGMLQPLEGERRIAVEAAYLDQHLSALDAEVPVLEQLLGANRRTDEGVLRQRLALLGLDARRLGLPAGALSGGERVRAAMALVLYAERPAQLLLLDEPGNHLDLAALSALERMLREFAGTLVVASHDERFLQALAPSHVLAATPAGWTLREGLAP